jgi:hypothetical protein
MGEVAAEAVDGPELCCHLLVGEVGQGADLLGQFVEPAELLVAQELLLVWRPLAEGPVEGGLGLLWLVEAEGLGDGSVGASLAAELDHPVFDRLWSHHGLGLSGDRAISL